MYTAKQVANFFIHITARDSDSCMTNMRINKLLYLAQVFYYHDFGKPLFSDGIEAWEYGPVVYDVYQKYHVCGDSTIRITDDDFDEDLFDDETADFLIGVEVDADKYSTSYLSNLSHFSEGSWRKSYDGTRRKHIPLEQLAQDYDYLRNKIEHFDFDEAVKEIPKYETYLDDDGCVVIKR